MVKAKRNRRKTSTFTGSGMSSGTKITKVSNIETPQVTLPLFRGGMPNAMVVTLQYANSFQHTGTGYTQQSYRMNGPNDPDVTGAGIQPVAYDQWAAFYGRAYCIHSTIKVIATNNDSLPVSVVLYPEFNLAGSGSMEDAQAQPSARWEELASSGGQNRAVMAASGSTKQFLGLNFQIDSLFSATNANPTTQSYWTIGAENLTSAAKDVYFQVRINYKIHFMYLLDLNDALNERFVLTDKGKVYFNSKMQERYEKHQEKLLLKDNESKSLKESSDEIDSDFIDLEERDLQNPANYSKCKLSCIRNRISPLCQECLLFFNNSVPGISQK